MPAGRAKYRKSVTNIHKRIKVEEDQENVEQDFGPGFMSLSDDVLLIIFSFLGPQDLLSLSQCCRRFEDVTRDRTLWENVDFRPDIFSLINLKKYIRFFQTGTKSISSCGPAYTKKQTLHPSLSKSFLRGVSKNAPNLSTLIIENHVIDSSKLILDDFPPTLRHLAIRRCVFNNIETDRSYFFKIDKSLPNLKILDLSNNEWFVPHSLLALSKSQTLEELNLSGCDVSDCLPYASLAANFGFSNLKVLDLRNTFVSDIEVSCFNRTSTLRCLYLEAPMSSVESVSRVLTPPDVTDYSITTFGGGPRDGQNNLNVSESVIIIEVGSYPRPPCKLETLILKGYPGITDTTLKHAALFLKDLRYLDVTGSGCTQEGALQFGKNRPDVKLVYNNQNAVT